MEHSQDVVAKAILHDLGEQPEDRGEDLRCRPHDTGPRRRRGLTDDVKGGALQLQNDGAHHERTSGLSLYLD